MSTEARQWLKRRVRIFPGFDTAKQGAPIAEGVVVGYAANPTICIRAADGRQSDWQVTLPIDVLEEDAEIPPAAPLLLTATEYLVRNKTTGWIYALPKLLPKFLDGKRGTREAAEWHLRQVAGPDTEDQTYFEIVERPIGPWRVSS